MAADFACSGLEMTETPARGEEDGARHGGHTNEARDGLVMDFARRKVSFMICDSPVSFRTLTSAAGYSHVVL